MWPFRKNNCPVTNCELTSDRKRVNESNYVVVLMSDSIEQPLPRVRWPTQRWVFNLIESPFYQRTYEQYNGYFNATADYLMESEFGNNYESQKRFRWAENKTFNAKHDCSQGQTGLIAALVSNCGAQNGKNKLLS